MGLPRKVDWYIVREFMGPFAFCVIGFTIILISGLLFELTDLIFVKSVPVETVGRMLLYKLPDMVVLTLPIAVLFATLVSLGRLVQDSEMKVLRVSGLSFPRLILPVVILGFVVSGVTYWASEEVVPEANHKYENTLRRIIFSEGIPLIEENVFFYGGENRYFYISEVDNERRELYNILVYELGNGLGKGEMFILGAPFKLLALDSHVFEGHLNHGLRNLPHICGKNARPRIIGTCLHIHWDAQHLEGACAPLPEGIGAHHQQNEQHSRYTAS
jgi:lipopolysaccharide export LptBFGC system permease protein LptF